MNEFLTLRSVVGLPAEGLTKTIAELPAIVQHELAVANGDPAAVAAMDRLVSGLRAAVSRCHLGYEARQIAAEQWLLIDRALGEILKPLVNRGRPSKNVDPHDNFRLADHHISRDLSSRAQELAGIPLSMIHDYFRMARQNRWEITWTGETGLRSQTALLMSAGTRGNAPNTADRYQYYRDSTPHAYLYHNDAGLQRNHGRRGTAQRQPANDVKPRPPTSRLYIGDCLHVMPAEIADHSIDLVVCDPPFGNTHRWTKPLDLPAMWQQLRRVLKPYHVIVLFAVQPFASRVISSAEAMFKCELIWEKDYPADFVHANHRPLSYHENILVFSEGALRGRSGPRQMPYFPEQVGAPQSGYPRSILRYPKIRARTHHPMQKPVALLEHLIALFSRPGDFILDPTMGSGSTGVAALTTGRSFIGIEKHPPFFETAQQWLKEIATNSL